jgi:hypothetical protein
MKKLFLFACFSVLGLAAYSQQLHFTKGNVAPGNIDNTRAYEDFIGRYITVTDENGVEYSFVKADFSLKAKDGKTIRLSLTKALFPEEEIGNIARASAQGTVYTFTNIIVKDKAGKEYTIPSVTYRFALGGN